MSRNRLLTILGLACIAGYSYFFYSLYNDGKTGELGACMIKNVTGLPCPSCGSTRAMMLLVNGDLKSSLLMNPIGILLAVIMIVVPLWIIYDLITRKQTLLDAYNNFEKFVNIKYVAVILIILVLANWIWNIQKNL